jgi:plastocyanin domain-containing protein
MTIAPRHNLKGRYTVVDSQPSTIVIERSKPSTCLFVELNPTTVIEYQLDTGMARLV